MISVGSILEGKVISVMPFGAFVDLGGKKSGLVHISEISSGYVKNINEHVKKGDILRVKVISIDDSGKISLSAKQAEEKKAKKSGNAGNGQKKEAGKKQQSVRPVDIDWSSGASSELSFEDKLSKFKHDSDENMQTLRRSAESKRSGGYSRRGGYSY